MATAPQRRPASPLPRPRLHSVYRRRRSMRTSAEGCCARRRFPGDRASDGIPWRTSSDSSSERICGDPAARSRRLVLGQDSRPRLRAHTDRGRPSSSIGGSTPASSLAAHQSSTSLRSSATGERARRPGVLLRAADEDTRQDTCTVAGATGSGHRSNGANCSCQRLRRQTRRRTTCTRGRREDGCPPARSRQRRRVRRDSRRADRRGVVTAAWLGKSSATPALRAALILCADHELDVSTFTARCIASARATPYEVVLGALAALRGRRHGGASEAVDTLFREVGQARRARGVLGAHLRLSGELAGFGHPAYPSGDPRARVLIAMARRYGSSSACSLADAIVQAARRLTGQLPNLDFGLVTLARALGLPQDAPMALFAVGRTIGWIAHAMEQYGDPQLIRPRGLSKSGECSATALDPEALAHGGDWYAGTDYAVLAASP